MIVIRNIKEKQRQEEWVATVGFFDGVHRGHRFLIEKMRQLAGRKGLPAAVFTFPVHPRVVLQAGYRPELLNSFDEKLMQLATTGVDYCVVMDFTPALAAFPARDFITGILAAQWHVRALLTGHDHRFGHGRTDGFEQYVTYGQACGMEIVQAPPYGTAAEGVVSSSRIRRLLSECRVAEAAQLLTYAYRLRGHIVSGHQVGRKIGFPTANIEVDDPLKVWPGMGVYAVWVHVGSERYRGMLSIGDRPTLKGDGVSIEVHLLHFSEAIYRQDVEVEFVHYLRENRKFDGLEALRTQLNEDRRQVEAFFLTETSV
jgi:riboflavin kinase/FMN adenylyltransferase